MARNIRNMAIKAYNVTYGMASEGKLVEANTLLDTNSPRRIMKELAKGNDVDPSQIVIISVEEISTEYRILDMVKAMEVLAEAGLAEVVVPGDSEKKPENADKKAAVKKK